MISLVLILALSISCVSCSELSSEENFRPYWNPIYAWVYSDVRCQPYYLQHTDRYFCTDDGVVVCLNGWSGDDCDIPVCSNSCGNGTCVAPDTCRCAMGYQGSTCRECLQHPGCKHGSCEKAFDCICDNGWEGLDCSIAQCSDGCSPSYGFCDAPGECSCKHGSGYTGENCTECITKEGCLFGTCNKPGECNCEDKLVTGEFCDKPVCSEGCNNTNGYCFEPNTCICELGWKGVNCTECVKYPGCGVNGTCIDPWECNCSEGSYGLLCDSPVPILSKWTQTKLVSVGHNARALRRRPGNDY